MGRERGKPVALRACIISPHARCTWPACCNTRTFSMYVWCVYTSWHVTPTYTTTSATHTAIPARIVAVCARVGVNVIARLSCGVLRACAGASGKSIGAERERERGRTERARC